MPEFGCGKVVLALIAIRLKGEAMFLSLKRNLVISHVLLYSLLNLSVPSQTQQASCLEVPVRLRVFPSPAVSLEASHPLVPVRLKVFPSPAVSLEASHLLAPASLKVFPSPAVSLETFHQLAPVRRRVSQYQQAIPVG